MDLLDEDKINWIEKAIRENGIHDEDLVISILDHLCCRLEDAGPLKMNWQNFIESEIEKMHPISLGKLEEEKHILINQLNNSNMKKTTRAIIICSISMLLLGVIFKIFHLAGASMFLVLGTCSGALSALIGAFQKVNDTSSILFASLTILILSFCLGILFKVQHWPFANIMMIAGALGVSLVYAPLNFVYLSKRNEIINQHIITHFLIFLTGIMIFMLFDLRAL
jgi:hypothetical protein